MPVLIGPDTNGFSDAVTFLKQAQDLGVAMHGITYHEYTTSVSSMRAETLAKMRNATNISGTAELWVGEAGGAAGGGHPGLTDSYSSGLWWLPALGEKAKSGHSIYCRQDLVGGDYGLLHDDYPWNVAVLDTPTAKENVITRPDYWSGLLFKRLMGNGVLETKDADSSQSAAFYADGDEPALLSYCHCSRRFDQGLAVLLVNPADANTTVTMQFTPSAASGPEHRTGSQWDAIIYRLTPGPNSTDILLNGELLQVTPSRDALGWFMPSLDGRNVSNTGDTHTVMMERQSYLFIEYPNAMVSACAYSQ